MADQESPPIAAETECPGCGHEPHTGWCSECGCLDDRTGQDSQPIDAALALEWVVWTESFGAKPNLEEALRWLNEHGYHVYPNRGGRPITDYILIAMADRYGADAITIGNLNAVLSDLGELRG